MKRDVAGAFLRENCKIILSALLWILWIVPAFAQENIPVGTWRTHQNFVQVIQLEGSGSTLFARTADALFYFSERNPTPTPLSRADKLYGQSPQKIAFHTSTKTLIVIYTDGTIDLVSESKVNRIDELRTSQFIRSKVVNQIHLEGNRAWLAGDFGIISIQIPNAYIDQSLLGLGQIFSATTTEDALYAASDRGVITGKKSSNLNDLNEWSLITQNPLFTVLTSLGEAVFALAEDGQIYRVTDEATEWLVGTSSVNQLKKIGDRVFFSMRNQLYEILENGDFYAQNQEILSSTLDFFLADNELFLAVPNRGLIRQSDGAVMSPNGLHVPTPCFVNANQTMLAFSPFEILLDRLVRGTWAVQALPFPITSLGVISSRIVVGTTRGLYYFAQDADRLTLTDSLITEDPVATMAVSSSNRLYAILASTVPSLLQIDPDGNMITSDLGHSSTPEKLVVDNTGNLWIIEPQAGLPNLRVINQESGLNRRLGNTVDQGGLPSNVITDIHLDPYDNLWIATSRGFAYVPNASLIAQNRPVNALLPIMDNRQVLANTFVTKILAAPDRSIWVGTASQGLWNFPEHFEGTPLNFSPSNSPLPSLEIHSMAMNQHTGELFVNTSLGAASYRSPSQKAAETLEQLKVYPNPIHPNYGGPLSIEGLTDRSTVKVTSTSGRVMATFESAGGKITWNLHTADGNRLTPGIYLIYVVTQDGKNRLAGKFLVM